VIHVEVRKGAYADSVALLQVSRDVAARPGVLAAQVAMATPLNVDVLAGMGFEVPDASPNDMVVALELESEDALRAALAAVDQALTPPARARGRADEELAPRTTRAALARSDADLVLVSVAGPNAAVEAMDALDAGRDVMVFSDNVPLDQELALKRAAQSRGLLVMGPDCGTAVVGGVGLGFANAVRPGPVGIVAASGTGCQQLLCLLDAAGVGVAAALGVGGRDLSAEVGGLSTREALRRLDADPSASLVVVVSKPPSESVAAELEDFTAGLGTPVQLALLGPGRADLTAAAGAVVEALGNSLPSWPRWGDAARNPRPGGLLRGLYAGGTLCDEAMLIASAALGPVRSNIPLSPELTLDASLTADSHTMVDFGDDVLTQGRAHPMIDPTLRLEHLARTAADPATSVVLLDVVLGHGADADPASSLVPVLERIEQPVVVACVGTPADPQDLQRQASTLASAGARVFLSNAEAARHAVSLVSGQGS
jgi:FdrA protein